MGDGLQDVPIGRHVADGPLAQTGTAQPEDVAETHRVQRWVISQVETTTGTAFQHRFKESRSRCLVLIPAPTSISIITCFWRHTKINTR